MMQLASIPGLFKTIMVIVLVYYIAKYALRLFIRVGIRNATRNSPAGSHTENKREGDVTIEYLDGSKPNNPELTRPDDADVVDFEEIKD